MYKVRKTLFAIPEMTKGDFKASGNIEVSLQFIECADNQLTDIFIRKTGITPQKQLCWSIANDLKNNEVIYFNDNKMYIKGTLYANHNWLPLTICWYSKTAKQIDMSNENVDCEDIIFDFASELQTELYIKCLYPNQKLPFKIVTPFELEVLRLNLDCTFTIIFTSPSIENLAQTKIDMENFINQYNEKSEKNNRNEGVIHNFNVQIKEVNSISIELDLGSVGFSFFKKVLKKISTIEGVIKVEIG